MSNPWGDNQAALRELGRHLFSPDETWHCIEQAVNQLPQPDGPVVYFIGSSSLRHIKIGKANDLRQRLRELQIGNPAPLYAYAFWPGAFDAEKLAHARFLDDRGNGEWFLVSADLCRTIGSLQAAIAQAAGLTLTTEQWEDDDV